MDLAGNRNEYNIDIKGHAYNLSARTHIMGVLNVTPDSFSDGGDYFDFHKAVERAFQMEREGADFIDIGGESTRPGAEKISSEEEERRVIPVIKILSSELSIPISIDTYKASIAENAVKAGAALINDISGLRFDPAMVEIAAKYSVPVIVMHIKGTPKNMQKNPVYNNLLREISDYLSESIEIAVDANISPHKIIVDPGIGFGKTVEDNLNLINNLNYFHKLHCPILIGVSRKSFIGKIIDRKEKERIFGTAAAVAASVIKGANIVRVHDVKEMVQVVNIIDKITTKHLAI
ncbi:MAG: dihydropteroate synthase [bacterium]